MSLRDAEEELVLAAMRTTGRDWLTREWVEVRVWASYPTPAALARGPDSDAVQAAVRRLIDRGLVETNDRGEVRLAESSADERERLRLRVAELERWVRNCRDNFDCDSACGVAYCRACEAAARLKEPK